MLMLLKFLEFRQVLGQFLIGNPLPIATVISHRKRNEMVSHNPYDIQGVVQMFQRLITKKFVFCVSHGLSCIVPLSPAKWEADTLPGSPPVTGKGAVTLRMSANTIQILNHILRKMSSVFSKNARA